MYPCFKSAEINDQTIISLGLNSILDLSFEFPEGQNTLFDAAQRKWLKNRLPPKKLFERSGLRLTWGDTTLSLDDIQSKNNMKVDLRILQDETVQRFNKETDTAVLEASKEDPGLLKYQSDHCKLMVECQNIIDMYIDKGHNVDNVDCLQICGLDLVILNLSLSAPGLYVANEVFFGSIPNSLSLE